MSPDQRTRALERRHDTDPTPETERALVRDLERRLGKRVTVGEPAATAWVALHRGKPMRAGPTRASVTAPLRFEHSGVSWCRMEEWGFTVAEFALYPREEDE